MVNEAIEQAIRAEKLGKTLSEIVGEYEIIKMARESGFSIILEELLFPIIEKVYARDKGALTKAWYESGQWYGKFFSVKFPDIGPLGVFDKVIRTLLWGVSDFAILRSGSGFMLRCISPRLKASYTELLTAFLEGVAHSLGYSVAKKDVLKGVIFLNFKPGERKSTYRRTP
jgi:hypothetical protein